MDVEITGQYYYENGTIFILHGLVYGVEDTKPEYQAAVQNFREKWSEIGTIEEQEELVEYLVEKVKSNSHIVDDWYSLSDVLKY